MRFQPACHNKTIIVDGETVMFGSHNWSNDGTTTNRDATLIIHDPEAAKYYEKIFLYDWENLARKSVPGERAMPRVERTDGASRSVGPCRDNAGVTWRKLDWNEYLS